MKQTISLFFLLLFYTSVFSQNDNNVNLNPVEVNASKTKILSQASRLITTIERVEIEQSAARSIDDLLKYVAGLDVRQRGTNGVQSDISIRGGSFDQLLVLLNGVNITDPQTGHYNLDIPVDLAAVSRIEIVQGSAARLLGINAFSGAINFITNENSESSLTAQITRGSYDYLSNNINGNYQNDDYQLFASHTYKSSSGHIANSDFKISNTFLQAAVGNEEMGRFNLQLAHQQKDFGANSFYSTTYPNQFEATQTYFAALSWAKNSGVYNLRLQVYHRRHHDRFELFRNFQGAEAYSWYTGHNYHLSDVSGFNTGVSRNFSKGESSLRFDLRNEHIFSNVLGKVMAEKKAVPFEEGIFFDKSANRLTMSIIANQSLLLNNWTLSGGVSLSQNHAFGFLPTGGIDISYHAGSNTRLFLAANTAVRLPTFTDLYYQSATQISNPNLKAEKSKTFEAGAEFQQNGLSFSGLAYYRMGTNIIDWVKAPDAEKWEARNLTGVNAFGADLHANYRFTNSFFNKITLSYSYLTMNKSALDLDSKYALDYLKHKAVLQVNHKIWDKLSAQWDTGYFNRSGNFTDFVTKELTNYPAYWKLDGKLMWSGRKTTIFAEVNNALNQHFVDFGGIVQPGTTGNLGIQLKVN